MRLVDRFIILLTFSLILSQIVNILPEITENRFLGPLATFLVREYRVLAYAQFLEAYKR
jgi:hypothetical protein